eukprot:scaffold258214_cov17-Tisochrysis_lutea.AAC.1
MQSSNQHKLLPCEATCKATSTNSCYAKQQVAQIAAMLATKQQLAQGQGRDADAFESQIESWLGGSF